MEDPSRQRINMQSTTSVHESQYVPPPYWGLSLFAAEVTFFRSHLLENQGTSVDGV